MVPRGAHGDSPEVVSQGLSIPSGNATTSDRDVYARSTLRGEPKMLALQNVRNRHYYRAK